MATEKTLQAYIIKNLRAAGWLVYKFASPSQRGVPDLICIAPGGDTVFVEVKHPDGTGRLSRLQQYCIDKIRHQGALVYVVASKDQADALLLSSTS